MEATGDSISEGKWSDKPVSRMLFTISKGANDMNIAPDDHEARAKSRKALEKLAAIMHVRNQRWIAQSALIKKMLHWAHRIDQQSGDGALHIFIADGNCDEDSLDFCAEQPNITPDEAAFLDELRADLREEAIFGAWALANA